MSSRPIAESATDLACVPLLAEAELPDGTMTAVKVRGLEPIALYRVGDSVHATQDTCTHAQASLTEGELEGDRVWCPVHSAEFCIRTGEALRFPASEPLRVFRVWIDRGRIYADLREARAEPDGE